MDHQEKITWMALWASRNRVTLDLEGSCGIMRDCVGITTQGNFPSYEWHDEDYTRIDNNGEVWVPANAYHKHPCVAVLGRGEEAESQLYDWLKWFDANGFTVEEGLQEVDPKLGILAYVMSQHRYARMVKVPASAQSIAESTV